jgi:hypothetical protein
MSQAQPATADRITLQTATTLDKLASPALIAKLCDDIFADLKMLCREVTPRGMDAIEDMFNYPYSKEFYVTSSNWMPPQGPREWYHGFYIGIGIDPPGRAGLGFLTEPVITEIRRRLLSHQTQMFEPKSRTVHSIGGPVYINGTVFDTSEGTYRLEHTHSWYLYRRNW